MKRIGIGLGVAAATMLAVGLSGIEPAWAAEQEYKPKVKTTKLIEEPLPGVEGKVVLIRQFELPPGHVGGKHLHPGPVYVYVLEGALTIEIKGQGTRTIAAGKLYKEPLRRVMQARNLSTDRPLKLVVFQIGDKGKPMMIKAE